MEALAKNKSIIKVVVVFVLAMLVYNFFFKPSEPAPLVTDEATSPANLGADLLKISSELSQANLSQAIFSRPSYLYLVDFSVALPQQSLGRLNPFDPIGRQ